jgi:uncharacterized protein (TIRG00374 family)
MRRKLRPYLARHWRPLLNLATFLALAALIYVTRHQIVETLNNIQNVNYWVLLLMIPIEILNYHAYAKLYKGVLSFLGDEVSYKDMYRISLELNFVNHVFPSGGVSGISFFSLRLKRFGVRAGTSTVLQLIKFILIFVSFELLLVFGLFSLAINGKASNLIILLFGVLGTLLVVGSLLLGYIVGDKKRINAFFLFFTKAINRVLHTIRPRHPETFEISNVKQILNELHDNFQLIRHNWQVLKAPFWYALLANATEVAAIYVVYIAFGHWVNLGAVIIAYAIANFAGLISVLPGGVGVYEVLMTGVLATMGVPPGISVPVTVMYRILNMIIQIPIGYVLYHNAIQNSGADIAQEEMPDASAGRR